MKKSILFASAFTLAVALPVVLHSSKAFSAVPVQKLATATKLPLKTGTVLKKGTRLTSPSNNNFQLMVDDAGGLHVWDKREAYAPWGFDLVIPDYGFKTGIDRVEFRADGSLGAYNKKGVAIWKAPVTRLDPKATLKLNKDGILQVVAANGAILWASNGAVGSLKPPSLPKPTAPKPNLPPLPTEAALTVEQQAEALRGLNAAFDKPIDADNPNYVLITAAVYILTNEARVKEGKSAVPYHPRLTNAAFDYAREMVTKDFFDHDHPSDPAQRTPNDRAKRAGIKNAKIAENIGYISSTGSVPMHTYRSLAQSLVDQWMNSPGHRANILSDDNRNFGCGVYYFFDRNANNKLMVKAVQKFQQFEDVKE